MRKYTTDVAVAAYLRAASGAKPVRSRTLWRLYACETLLERLA
jgi:hypothetical protein